MNKYAKIKQRIESSGLTRREFARQEGISLATLYNWIKKAGNVDDPGFISIEYPSPIVGNIRIQTTAGVIIDIPV